MPLFISVFDMFLCIARNSKFQSFYFPNPLGAHGITKHINISTGRYG